MPVTTGGQFTSVYFFIAISLFSFNLPLQPALILYFSRTLLPLPLKFFFTMFLWQKDTHYLNPSILFLYAYI